MYICFLTTNPSQVEPNTKLFPAVVVLPTNQNVIQFELGKLKVRPIPEAACWKKEKKHIAPGIMMESHLNQGGLEILYTD